jgi:hypothetical protein
MHEPPVPDPATVAITSIGKSIPTSDWLMRSPTLGVEGSIFAILKSLAPVNPLNSILISD